nr:YfiR family protein [Acidobacteriota bacterium]
EKTRRTIVDGQAVRGRTVVVHALEPDASLSVCHVLFVTKESAGRAGALQRAATLPILTISDEAHFLDEGGIIQLRTIDNRVRF